MILIGLTARIFVSLIFSLFKSFCAKMPCVIYLIGIKLNHKKICNHLLILGHSISIISNNIYIKEIECPKISLLFIDFLFALTLNYLMLHQSNYILS